MKTYSESDIKAAIDDMICNNEDNIQYSTGGYDRGYPRAFMTVWLMSLTALTSTTIMNITID